MREVYLSIQILNVFSSRYKIVEHNIPELATAFSNITIIPEAVIITSEIPCVNRNRGTISNLLSDDQNLQANRNSVAYDTVIGILNDIVMMRPK